MAAARVARVSGVAGLVGGTVCVFAGLGRASLLRACSSQDCGGPSAGAGTAWVLLALAGVLLIGVCVGGMLLATYLAGGLERAGKAGAMLGTCGVLVLMAGVGLWAPVARDSFSIGPVVVLSGLLMVMLGFALTGLALSRSGLLPQWVGISLGADEVVVLGLGDELGTVLLLTFFGLVWCMVGFLLLTPREPSLRPTYPVDARQAVR